LNIHEYQAKEIFSRYGIPVHAHRVVSSAEEACRVAGELAEPGSLFVVKAQVHAGGRGKAGGIKLVRSVEEVKDVAGQLIGSELKTIQTGSSGKPIDRLIVEATRDIAKEFYVSVVLDRVAEKPCLIVSEAGGMDIEAIAATEPQKIIRRHFDSTAGLNEKDVASLAERLIQDQSHANLLKQVFMGMAQLFLELDASLVEINPLAIMDNDEMIAIDAKINFDDNALFRHPDIAALRDPRQEDSRESEAKKFDLSYVGLDGNIGCIVNGAGLAMATMDIIKFAGGEPANFLDVGGGANQEKVAAAFKIILKDPNVKAILINIFGGIMRCDVVAEGVLEAVTEVGVKVPIVVRLEGTNAEQGKKILQNAPFKIISASSFGEAAEKAVEAAQAH